MGMGTGMETATGVHTDKCTGTATATATGTATAAGTGTATATGMGTATATARARAWQALCTKAGGSTAQRVIACTVLAWMHDTHIELHLLGVMLDSKDAVPASSVCQTTDIAQGSH